MRVYGAELKYRLDRTEYGKDIPLLVIAGPLLLDGPKGLAWLAEGEAITKKQTGMRNADTKLCGLICPALPAD